MIREKTAVIILMILSLLIISCGDPRYTAPVPAATPQLGDLDPSSTIIAEIYYDATPSMVGYVNPGEATCYGRAMEVLESSLIKGWPEQEVSYFKFGTQIVPITRHDSLKARTPVFYNDLGLCLETHIDQVIDRADPENLTIIVTDLFQNDADINLLIGIIKEKYIANNYAVGIAGFKSEFTGKLYDIGINRYTYTYDSGFEQDKFRPFYLLVLGKPGDVIKYFDQLKHNEVTGKLDHHFMLVTSRIYKNPATFKNSRILESSKIIDASHILPQDKNDERVKQYLIRKKDYESVCWIGLEVDAIPYTLEIDADKIESSFKVGRLNDGKFIEDRLWNDSISIENIKLKERLLELKLLFNSTGLQKGIYSYHISVRPQENAYKIPDWVYEWNMDTSQIDKWNKDPSTFNETTTLNLEPFISGLCQSSTQFHKTYPDIADVYFYIDKK